MHKFDTLGNLQSELDSEKREFLLCSTAFTGLAGLSILGGEQFVESIVAGDIKQTIAAGALGLLAGKSSFDYAEDACISRNRMRTLRQDLRQLNNDIAEGLGRHLRRLK